MTRKEGSVAGTSRKIPDGRRMRAIYRRLLAWFGRSAREMDWRNTDDPYRIWVSDVMLQQTRVETVIPYYRRFLSAFPTVRALAGAPRDRVMKLWEGLGYYSRVRNLHRAAELVARENGGRVPEDPEALAALPGIGRSTAGAIAAIAFRKDTPILDANAKRVIARLFAVSEPLSRSSVERRLWELSRGLIEPGKGRETALALMDLGAMICTPRRPDCPACPLRPRCEGRSKGLQETIPAKTAKKDLPRHDVVVAWIADGKGRVLVGRRPERGLLGGLWELPGGRRRPKETREEALRRELRQGWGMGVEIGERIASMPHGYSHFRITLHAYRCRRAGKGPRTEREWRWARPKDLTVLAFPRAYRKMIEAVSGDTPGG
ncbi:MAG: A/G-specific adenine glycosylase [Candidatus Deferrimicrobiaceae bacterium]